MALGVGGRDLLGALLALAAAAAVLALPAGREAYALSAVAAFVLAGWIALQDLADYTIPDGAVLGLALVGLACRAKPVLAGILTPGDAALLAGLDLLLAGGGLWLVREIFYRRRGFDGLGFGDVKLGAAGGLLVGTAGFSVALAAAGVTGVALLLLRHGPTAEVRGIKLAFGALLAPAIALVFAVVPDPIAGGGP